jgi:hypothetical protein
LFQFGQRTLDARGECIEGHLGTGGLRMVEDHSKIITMVEALVLDGMALRTHVAFHLWGTEIFAILKGP